MVKRFKKTKIKHIERNMLLDLSYCDIICDKVGGRATYLVLIRDLLQHILWWVTFTEERICADQLSPTTIHYTFIV